uniref:HORMA domain-containing protein n=1 Tax=Leptobrachium leishanense TaxID=445787 RepID=A0A8C5Q120_9ANUR
MAISVSCITYLRGIFPEDAYKTRYLEGNVQTERRRVSAKRHQISLIESYQFKFNYTISGPQMDIVSNKNHLLNVTMDDIKSASICLIRKLFLLMHNLGPLPGDVALTMKLFYYDAVTPPQYQPPGFKEGETHIILFEGNPVNVKLAEVSTSFHVIKVRVTTDPCVTAEELRKDLSDVGTEVSAQTIRRTLRNEDLHARTPRRTPLLSPKNKKSRLQYAKSHVDKPQKFWDSVLWTDETKLEPSITLTLQSSPPVSNPNPPRL